MLKETAIAAYGSLGNLLNLLENVYDRIKIGYPPLDAQPFHALQESVDFFLCQLNAHSGIKSKKLRKLWWEIAEFAHEADEIIDAHVVGLLHKEERYTEHSSFYEHMETVNQAFHKIKADLLIAIKEGEDDTHGKEDEGEDTDDAEEREDAHEEEESADIQKEDKEGGDTDTPKASSSAGHASSATSSHAKDYFVVGLDDKVIEMKDELINTEVHLPVITITGIDSYRVDRLNMLDIKMGRSTFWEEVQRVIKEGGEDTDVEEGQEYTDAEEGNNTDTDAEEGEDTDDAEEREEAHQEETADTHKIKADLLTAIEDGDDTQRKEDEGEDTDADERVEAREEEIGDTKKEDTEGGDTQGENIQALKRRKVSSSIHASSATSSHTKDDNVVGLDEKLIDIKDQLMKREPNLQIITITGMGGIGKTTLAKTVYGDPGISHHFDVRLRVAVSQEYVKEDVIQRLLDSGEKKIFSRVEAREKHRDCESSSDLGLKLYQGLIGRRYLVVMDDVWSTKIWEDLKWSFPDNKNGSRILITTRDSTVASSLSPASEIKMEFLNMDSSWKLLCQKAFPKENGDCPIPELEEVGLSIARGCKGLPLSIVVIGSMLAASPMTREYWESVAKDVNSFGNLRDDGHCLKVLSLSYNNLPIHLKACFLYICRFYHDSEIDRAPILTTWITWGLIHPVQGMSKESLAEEYFGSLVGRNLILIHKYHISGEERTFGLHDLLRELSVQELRKNQFISSPVLQQYNAEIAGQKLCVYCCKPVIVPGSVITSSSSSSQVSLCVCEFCTNGYQHIKRQGLVKVMDIVGEYSSPELVHPTTLQVLLFQSPIDLKFVSPSFFHILWRLHTLFISRSDSKMAPIVLPFEIWRMPQLKEIEVIEAVLTYPSDTNMKGNSIIILKNLYRLMRIRKFRCTQEVVDRIPNLRELSICDSDDSNSCVDKSPCSLAMFQKLEVLEVDMPIRTSKNISFPKTLKRLVLKHTRIPWEDISMIGTLPNLEYLELKENAFVGPEWNPTEGEFLKLKVLEIGSHDDLLYWNAEDTTHFPILEALVLVGINQELGIPDGIRYSPTLKTILLDCCGAYVIYSAIQILKEQREDYGNEELTLFIKEKDERAYKLGGGR